MSKNEPSNPEIMIRVLEQQIELLKLEKARLSEENARLKTQVQIAIYGFVGAGMLIAFMISMGLWVSSFGRL